MYKGVITTPIAVTAGVNIPFVTELNTNSETAANNGAVTLRTTGYKNLFVNAVLTGIAEGQTTLQVFANGIAIPEAVATVTSTADTDVITASIQDVLKVIPNGTLQDAILTVQLSTAGTVNNAVFSVQKVR